MFIENLTVFSDKGFFKTQKAYVIIRNSAIAFALYSLQIFL
jgi:hypothetical protein